MDNQDVIATLNDLLEISRDGEQGFHTCAEGVESPNLKVLFEFSGAALRRRRLKPRFAVSAVNRHRVARLAARCIAPGPA